jgi:hypothetical protein
MVVRGTDYVCFDAPGGLVAGDRKEPIAAAVKEANKHWRDQDPARKNKPCPYVVAKYERVK